MSSSSPSEKELAVSAYLRSEVLRQKIAAFEKVEKTPLRKFEDSTQLKKSEDPKTPLRKFEDSTQLKKSEDPTMIRRKFEDQISDEPNYTMWIKYSCWEVSQNEIERARNIYERALKIHGDNPYLWGKYAQMEIKNKSAIEACIVFERAVSVAPNLDALWWDYLRVKENMLRDVPGTRQVYERWMQYMPVKEAWISFIRFELRHNEPQRAEEIYKSFVQYHTEIRTRVRSIIFEMENGNDAAAKECYKRAVQSLTLSRGKPLLDVFIAFEKQHWDKKGIDNDATDRRRLHYEDEVNKNPQNYRNWFDFIRFEEGFGVKERVREVYKWAIRNVPPTEKRYWDHYIHIWIRYALYEKLQAQDIDRCRKIFRKCRERIPHEKFSFPQVWLYAAEVEIEQANVNGARQILSDAIQKAPGDEIFKKYIEIELDLGNLDKCRELFHSYFAWSPHNCCAWEKFAEMETLLGETDKANAIYERAIAESMSDNTGLLL